MGSPSAGSPVDQALPSQSRSAREGVHLVQVNPNTRDKEADVDIIAIHGLDTKSPDTWTWRSGDVAVNWLSDSDMLPKRFPTARIFTCDWPAHLFRDRNTVESTVKELARSLLLGIRTRPGGDTSRPLLFIASCLGGIILTQALVIAAKPDSEYGTVWTATGGVVFLATPFRGTSFKDIASFSIDFLKVYSMLTDKVVTKLLDSVKESTPFLEGLVGDFTKICRQGEQEGRLAIFYETKESNLLRKLLIRQVADLMKPPKLLVPSHSACLDIVHNRIGLARTHVEMNKFRSNEDPGFHAVVGRLEMILCEIRNGRPIEKADTWIRSQCYGPERLKLERLSGNELPMGQCYINLAIIEKQKDVKRPEEQSNPGDTAVQSSPFSLAARLKIDKPDKQVQVELPKIFNKRKSPDGQDIEPRRILIRGRAGVGKTTLCKKMVYDFVHHGTWRHLFDRVLWVPLRRLKGWGSGPYNFEQLFLREFFFEHKDPNKYEPLIQALGGALGDGDTRTLFILDGLDEVSREWNSNTHEYGFLRMLLNEKNVIITSRPFAEFRHGVDAIDLELETVGFYPEQVDEYIEKVFIDAEKSREVQLFLSTRPLLRDLVRIPIQLDALCWAWKGEDTVESKLDTMTAIYTAIEIKLWKKDIGRLDQYQQSAVLWGDIEKAGQGLTRKIVEKEQFFLELLAFTGLKNDIIDFDWRYREEISKCFDNFSVDPRLMRTSFLRTSDPPSKNKEHTYHFIHLTYQEYFAAQYFVRQWKSKQPLKCLPPGDQESLDAEPKAFLQKYKYDTRYDIMWRFVSGMLDADKQAHAFFNAIEEQPRDLLGPAHQRLIMHCLHEVSQKRDFRKRLEQKMSDWLIFECEFTGESFLARETDFPENALKHALEDGSQRVTILRSIRYRQRVPSSILDLMAVWLFDKELSGDIVTAIQEVLKSQSGSLSEPILQSIAARLDDSEEYIRQTASRALEQQAGLPEPILQSIATQLNNSNSEIQWAAIEVLGWQASLPEPILQSIAARLDDSKEYIRQTANRALGRQADLPEPILQSITIRLDSCNSDIRCAAIKVLSQQASLPEPILQSIATRLDNDNSNIRTAAIKVLSWQASLPEPILQSIAIQLNSSKEYIRQAAINALSRQADLPEPILQSIAIQLNNSNSETEWNTIYALRRQASLPEPILQWIATQLDNSDSETQQAAIEALGRQAGLPEPILQSIATQLNNSNSGIQWTTIEALSRQASLPEPILQWIVTQLDSSYSEIRLTASMVLSREASLPEPILQSIAERLKNESTRDEAERTLRNHHKLYSTLLKDPSQPFAYSILLRHSFREQLSWHIDNAESFLVTVRPPNHPDSSVRATTTP
ncbi:hypothetical protein B0T17DRAFT_576975 [Bombardia bombarda]|uniref:NACHT domain-containing protein n=1 Tax=Bombardia bombarda TaxID=252184 RepID=A0AA39WZM4_9PEZI|nr:hypothetical protein B0T17DRAFT_576975 [Bombardia bombarda]